MRTGEDNELTNAIEAILFVSGEAVQIGQIANALDTGEKEVRAALCELKNNYDKRNGGLVVIETNGAYRLATKPIYYNRIAQFNKAPETKPMTRPQLETLAIVAYRQPVTRAEVERIRGVDAAYTINKLLEYGLIEERGRDVTIGRPVLFGTTNMFLERLGLSSLSDLQ